MEMGQSDGVVLTCTTCHLEQQGCGTGLSDGGVALQSPVTKAGRASDCHQLGSTLGTWVNGVPV